VIEDEIIERRIQLVKEYGEVRNKFLAILKEVIKEFGIEEKAKDKWREIAFLIYFLEDEIPCDYRLFFDDSLQVWEG